MFFKINKRYVNKNKIQNNCIFKFNNNIKQFYVFFFFWHLKRKFIPCSVAQILVFIKPTATFSLPRNTKKVMIYNIYIYNIQRVIHKWSRGLMDKALASGAGDCGFESHRDRLLTTSAFCTFIIGKQNHIIRLEFLLKFNLGSFLFFVMANI